MMGEFTMRFRKNVSFSLACLVIASQVTVGLYNPQISSGQLPPCTGKRRVIKACTESRACSDPVAGNSCQGITIITDGWGPGSFQCLAEGAVAGDNCLVLTTLRVCAEKKTCEPGIDPMTGNAICEPTAHFAFIKMNNTEEGGDCTVGG